MPVFLPSLVLNFTLKFDEKVSITDEGPVVSVRDGLDNPGKIGPPNSPSPLLGSSGGASYASVLWRVPITATVDKPGYRQASRFQASLDFVDLPIDPRTIAAAKVDVHIGTVSADDFAKGMEGRELNRTRLSVLKAISDKGAINASTLKMVAYIDEWEVEHGESGSTVIITGRDLRGILLDTPINDDPALATTVVEQLDMSRPINEVVTQILSIQGFFAEAVVVCNPSDWPDNVIPAPAGLEHIPRHRKGAKGKRKSGRATPNSATVGAISFWDLIVRVCYFVGAVPYINNLGQIVIRNSSTVYDALAGPVDPILNPTPFKGGQPRVRDAVSGAPLPTPLRTRKLVYGRDIQSSSFLRKFAGNARPKVVRAFSYTTDTPKKGGAIVSGIWPPQKPLPRKTKDAPGKGPSMEEVLDVRVSGITDETRLTFLAKAIFEEFGRGEMTGHVRTPNLASFGGDNADPDLLRLEPGDGIEILVDTRPLTGIAPLIGAYTDDQRRSFAEQVAEVTRRVGSKTLARAIVATARGQINEVQRYFLTQNVKYAWSESGISVAFDFINYVVARWDESTADLAQIVNTDSQITFTEDQTIIGSLPIRPTTRRPTPPQEISFTEDHVVSGNQIPRSPLRR